MNTWTHTHPAWWQAASGESIHAVEILDDDDQPLHLFYGYAAGAVRHCCEAESLDEARQQIESMKEAA